MQDPAFRELDSADQEQVVGAKAHRLFLLRSWGMPVPEGFVVTRAAFDHFLAQAGLGERIASCQRDLSDATGSREEAEIAGRIRALILAGSLPRDLAPEFDRRIMSLGVDQALAVRSSAIGEDSAAASYAGQLDSILGIRTVEDARQALLRCWASFYSDRVVAYQRNRRVALGGMAVVVQRLVPSAVSGVLFSRSPRAETAVGTMLGEYCFGLGDKLVSGQLNPGSFTLQRDGRYEILAAPEIPANDGPSGAGSDSAWQAVLPELATLAQKLEARLGAPQDIEWCVDDRGKLYLLQTRPITTSTRSPAETLVWSNANVSENFPDPISPLLYSVARVGYYHYFRNLALAMGLSRQRVESMEVPLRHIIGVHGARMYYNLSNIHAVVRMAPMGEILSGIFNRFVGAGEIAPSPRGSSSWDDPGRSRFSQTVEVVVVAGRAFWLYRNLPERIRRFEAEVEAYASRTSSDILGELEDRDLGAVFREFLDIRRHRWLGPSLADVAAGVCYGALERLVGMAGHSDRSDPAAVSQSSLLKGIDDLVSSEPVLALWKLSRQVVADPDLAAVLEEDLEGAEQQIFNTDRFSPFRAELIQYLEAWGFRCSGELMLTTPSFQDDPKALLAIIRTYSRREGKGPAQALADQARRRDRETIRLVEALRGRRLCNGLLFPFLARSTRWVLDWTHHAIRFRERARLKQALLYSRFRRVALEIGRRLAQREILGQADDIFYLSFEEIEDLLSSSAMFPYRIGDLVLRRREEHADLGRMSPPDVVSLPAGEFLPVIMAGAGAMPADPAMMRSDEAEGLLWGTGACGGSARGRATVLREVSEAGILARGDILVTRQTDPGWGPVFFLIDGLVIERGGMLSHGAILAREFGIPAVVGVPSATQRILPGQTLEIDGDAGRVRLLG